MYEYSIKLELAWRRDNNGTDDSLTSCYSAIDDPRREDKAGLHVNCDDLLGGYDCRCLAGGGRGKQQAFYPSISPSFCSCLHAMIVMLQARQYTHTYKKNKIKPRRRFFFLRVRNPQDPEKQQRANQQLFNRSRRLQEKLQSLFTLLYPTRQGTRYSSVLVSVSDERSIKDACSVFSKVTEADWLMRHACRSHSGFAWRCNTGQDAYIYANKCFWVIMVNSPCERLSNVPCMAAYMPHSEEEELSAISARAHCRAPFGF
jgi:hypothetical protein